MDIPKNERWISVPKNSEGKQDCDYGEYETENVVNYDVSDNEFRALLRNGSIVAMNTECGLMIQDYESEVIPVDKIARCMSIVREHGDYIDGAFMQAFKSALNFGTFVQLEF